MRESKELCGTPYLHVYEMIVFGKQHLETNQNNQLISKSHKGNIAKGINQQSYFTREKPMWSKLTAMDLL